MNKITFKIILLSFFASLFLAVLIGVVTTFSLMYTNEKKIKNIKEILSTNFDRMVRLEVETVNSMIQKLYDMGQKGEITPELAKDISVEIVRDLRYDKEGYFWMDTVEGVNVALLGRDTEGTNRYEAQDKKNNFYVKDFISNGLKESGGYTDYWFTKKEGTDVYPKRSYTLAFKPYNWVIGTGNYIDDIDLLVNQQKASFSKETFNLILFIIGAIIVSQLMIIFISIFVGKKISKPIIEISSGLKEISSGKGDLSKKLTSIGKDELGQMAGYFNNFIDILKDIVTNIKRSCQDLNHVGNNLSSNIGETATAIKQINKNITNTKNLIENQVSNVVETSAAVEEMARNIESLSNVIEDQSSNIIESSSSIEEMIANIKSIAGTVKKANDLIEKLTETSDSGRVKLSNVIDIISAISKNSENLLEANTVISNIAEQTNLLAMNAAIEAAHAGELGKGFAVVADEIRKLAEIAGSQSNSVNKSLNAIKSSIDQVVVSSGETSDGFENILSVINSVKEIFEEIERGMDEQTSGSKQILTSLNLMQNITGSVKNGANEMNEGNSQILIAVTNLNSLSQEVKEAINEITANISDIEKVVFNITELGEKNKANILNINSETSKFIIE